MLSPAFGGIETSAVFGLTFVLYYAIAGLIVAFLWTKTLYKGILQANDYEADRKLQRLELDIAAVHAMPRLRQHVMRPARRPALRQVLVDAQAGSAFLAVDEHLAFHGLPFALDPRRIRQAGGRLRSYTIGGW